MKKRAAGLVLAALLALVMCTGAASAYCQPVSAAGAQSTVYLHGHHGGGHHGGGHHGSSSYCDVEACDWLFHAYGRCTDVNCTNEDHFHRCELDCDNTYHRHYGVCRYADGSLALVKA